MRNVLSLTDSQVLNHGRHLVTLNEHEDNFVLWCSDCNLILDYFPESELEEE